MLKWKLITEKDIKHFADNWIFSIDKREEEKTKDLACLLSELYYSSQFIEIKWYKTVFNSEKTKSNEEHISKSILWQVTWIQSKIDWNTFSVTIANQAVRKKIWKQDKPGLRSYILTDLNWKLKDWITISTSSDFLSKNIDNWEITKYTKTFIDNRRWVSIVWNKYHTAKLLVRVLKKEKKLLEEFIEIMENNSYWKFIWMKRSILSKWFWLYWPTKETYKKITKQELTTKIKTFYLEVEPEWYETTEILLWLEARIKDSKDWRKYQDYEVFKKIVNRYKFVKEYYSLLKFNTRATEVSFFQKIQNHILPNKNVNLKRVEEVFQNVNWIKIESITKNTKDSSKFSITNLDWNKLLFSIRMKTEKVKLN